MVSNGEFIFHQEDCIYNDGDQHAVFWASKIGELNKNYVAKVVGFVDEADYENFHKECAIAKMASDGEYGPRLHSHWVRTENHAQCGIMIMERFGKMVPERLDSAEDEQELARIIHLMHDDRVVHTDLYRRNILMKFDVNLGKNVFRIIDFGLAFMMQDPPSSYLRAIDWASLRHGMWNANSSEFIMSLSLANDSGKNWNQLANLSSLDWKIAYRWKVADSERSLTPGDIANCLEMYSYMLPKISQQFIGSMSMDALLDRMAFMEFCQKDYDVLEDKIYSVFN